MTIKLNWERPDGQPVKKEHEAHLQEAGKAHALKLTKRGLINGRLHCKLDGVCYSASWYAVS